MAIDLDAIRRKVQQLSGQNRNSSIQMWKPKAPFDGKVRGIPWKETPDGQPFIERWFYYIGDSSILAPNQFGKADPINELIRKLYSSGKPEDKELAKQLRPRMRAYMAVIVRGEEDKGPQVWSFGKTVYQKLLGYYLDEEVGDILSPDGGFDIKVKISQQPGKQFADTEVEAARSSTRLSTNPDQVKKWLSEVPNIDDMYKQKSTEEIERILTNWLNSSASEPQPHTDGSSRGNSEPDALDKLTAELKSDVPAKTADAPKQTKTKAKKPELDDLDAPQTSSKKTPSLDEAFADLEDSE